VVKKESATLHSRQIGSRRSCITKARSTSATILKQCSTL